MIETTKLYIFISFVDLDHHARSQLYEKSKTLVSVFCANVSIELDEIQCVALTCLFVEAHAKFFEHK